MRGRQRLDLLEQDAAAHVRAQGQANLRVWNRRGRDGAVDLGQGREGVAARRVAAGEVAFSGEVGHLAAAAHARPGFAVGATHLHGRDALPEWAAMD